MIIIKAQQVDARIRAIQDKADEEITAVLQAALQAEFNRVHKICPSLKAIRFGMGGYFMDDIKDKFSDKYDIASGAYIDIMPKYLRKLWELCQIASSYAIADILPQ
jgi:hypothetical protein